MLNNTSISVKKIRALLNTSVFSNFINLSSIQLSNALIMMILYPILARKVGLEAFGAAMVANASVGLIGIIINFGTSQSGIKDIATNKDSKPELSRVFYSTLLLRLILFLVFITGLILYDIADFSVNRYFLFAIPLVFAEVLNPLFIYLGKESLSVYNISNLIVKIFIILLVILTIQGPSEAIWINFILGTVHFTAYFFLLVRIVIISKIQFKLPSIIGFKTMLKNNFYLVGNNLSVQLQQSLMLLVLAKWGNPAWIGPYSICDKITWSGRLLIISICNSVYPKATNLYNNDPVSFANFKKKIRIILLVVFSLFSSFLIVFADPIVHLIAGHPDPISIYLLRIMAFLQVLAAINSFNVIELLIKGGNFQIFRIAMVLLIISTLLSISVSFSKNLTFLGTYSLFIELAALLMYEYEIHRNKSSIYKAQNE